MWLQPFPICRHGDKWLVSFLQFPYPCPHVSLRKPPSHLCGNNSMLPNLLSKSHLFSSDCHHRNWMPLSSSHPHGDPLGLTLSISPGSISTKGPEHREGLKVRVAPCSDSCCLLCHSQLWRHSGPSLNTGDKYDLQSTDKVPGTGLGTLQTQTHNWPFYRVEGKEVHRGESIWLCCLNPAPYHPHGNWEPSTLYFHHPPLLCDLIQAASSLLAS